MCVAADCVYYDESPEQHYMLAKTMKNVFDRCGPQLQMYMLCRNRVMREESPNVFKPTPYVSDEGSTVQVFVQETLAAFGLEARPQPILPDVVSGPGENDRDDGTYRFYELRQIDANICAPAPPV